MKIGFVNQPIDQIIPPIQSSIGVCTYGIVRPLAQHCKIIVYGRSNLTSHKMLGRDFYEGDVHFRFFPASLYDKVLFKLWWKYASLIKLLNQGMKPPISTTNWLYPQFLRKVAKDLRLQKCDVIHIQHCSQYVPLIRALNPNAKVVLHLHAEWFPQCNYRMLEKRLQHVDLVTTVSDYITEKTRRDFPQISDRCETIYNGIDSRDFAPERNYSETRNRSVKRIMYAGAISPHKGLHVLLDAFEIVAKQYPEVHLDIAGPPGAYPMEENFDLSNKSINKKMVPYYVKDYPSYLHEKLSAITASRVSFLGAIPRSELIDRYYNVDVFVFPTVCDEGFGLPPLEAMAAGVPVVVSKSGAMVETVEDGKTGFLVDKDDFFALAEAILRLLKNDDLRETMGRAGRKRAFQYFTWDKIAENALKRYQKLCEN